MAKKSKGNKQKSARGHIEGNVIRWREKKELIRVDKDGKPIKKGSPINTFDKNWLSGQLLSDISAPPVIPRRESPPSNVTSIAAAREKKAEASKPVSQSGNEAEVVKTAHATKHGWLHDKALAMSEFKHWSRLSKEIGRQRCGSEPWVKRKGKLSSPSLEAAREAAQNGHKGLIKLRFKKPPSITHNPLLKAEEHGGYSVFEKKHKPLDPKFYMPPKQTGSAGMAPSGLPIRVFTEGGKYAPPESSVVYTTGLPPTPTRDWRASNDAHYRAKPVVSVHDWAVKTHGLVQWFINHVEPQNWPAHVNNFVTWRDGGPLVNTGAINEAASHPETELLLVKSLNQGLEKDWRMIDSALADAVSENNLLRQELEATKDELKAERQANNLMEYELSHRQGKSPDQVRLDYVVKSQTPSIPDDVDGMLFQYRMFQSFSRMDGQEVAFARFVYGDPRLGEVMRDHADMRCKERQSAVEHRNMVRFLRNLGEHILSTAQAEYEQQKHDDYVNFWTKQYPVYLLHRQRRNITAVRDPAREAVAYAAMSRKAKPALHKPSSIYYSTLRRREVNDAVAKSLIGKVKPARVRYNNPNLVEHDTRKSWAQPTFKGVCSYEQWWSERLDHVELEYQKKAHPIRVGVVKAYNKAVDILNTPVDPATRRKRAQLREQMREYMHQQDEKRERRKEERAEAKRIKAERDHIRKMQRIAH
ncbi:MAG: hypothetical protein Tp1100MES1331091_55 [Prokaryotic dsDNA virus sp.]|nr:MAG: hypothetical protein Tp1100MES1331091_55 [Prokaryotic dsDNA virus sp.]|tara:strand:- start:39193 stop:41292 length:2100 start_codon:yes stop_codon:yes gene_type:complete